MEVDYAIEPILGQCLNKVFHTISYASKTFTKAELNYTTMEKELLAVVYALEKFKSYLIGTKVIVYTNNATLGCLVNKKDAKYRLICCKNLIWRF